MFYYYPGNNRAVQSGAAVRLWRTGVTGVSPHYLDPLVLADKREFRKGSGVYSCALFPRKKDVDINPV